MPDMNGIDFVRSIDSGHFIIFTTAHPEYALEGFKLNAIDYLLKPFSYEEFMKATQKVISLVDLVERCHAAESEMEFEYDDVAESLIVRYNTFKGLAGDYQLSASDSYLIEFEVVEPLIVRTSIEEGKVDILYTDYVENTSRSLSVVIANRMVTFATKR
jgi:YesN/AraC family two-component response regulator